MRSKLEKNRTVLEESRRRTEELQTFVSTQEAKAQSIAQQLPALEPMPASSSDAPYEAELLRQLADYREKRSNAVGQQNAVSTVDSASQLALVPCSNAAGTSRELQLGAQLYDSRPRPLASLRMPEDQVQIGTAGEQGEIIEPRQGVDLVDSSEIVRGVGLCLC